MTRYSEEFGQYLVATSILDADHPQIIEYTNKHTENGTSDEEKAIRLYYAVRDDIYYDPYHIRLADDYMRASNTLKRGEGFCMAKANLLAAVYRAAGIPSRLGYADVKNHVTTERMKQNMESDVFIYHGYTEVYLNGKWVKATPAFNLSLCEKFKIKPLEFDGKTDSIFHEFDEEGNKHMEYVMERGHFHDFPMEEVVQAFQKEYPNWSDAMTMEPSANFEAEAKPL